jgi:hypothetical protein
MGAIWATWPALPDQRRLERERVRRPLGLDPVRERHPHLGLQTPEKQIGQRGEGDNGAADDSLHSMQDTPAACSEPRFLALTAPPFWLASRVVEQSAVSVHGPRRRFCFEEQYHLRRGGRRICRSHSSRSPGLPRTSAVTMIAASVGPNGKMPPEMSLSTSSGHLAPTGSRLHIPCGGAQNRIPRLLLTGARVRSRPLTSAGAPSAR